MRIIANRLLVTVAVVSLPFLAIACQPSALPEQGVDEMPPLSAVTLGEGERLQVVATTSIVGDVVQNVGGGLIDLSVLMPAGTDPHSFEPTPQDVAAVADAHVVFANGAGLEEFLEPLLESADENATVVPVSYGIELLQLQGGGEEEHDQHGGVDPHVWFDPNNVAVWALNIAHVLSTLDPNNAGVYEENAAAYTVELERLDSWIREQLAQVPEENRKLVTDHASFSYFAQRYGFEQVGSVLPGYSTLAESSAQELAELEDAIIQADVKAVFVGLTVNPDLAQRVADDTGTRLVFLYTGSLSEPGGPADNYLAFMRYNVSAIAEALR